MIDDKIEKFISSCCFTRMWLLEWSHMGKDFESFDVISLKKNCVCIWIFLISQKEVLQISWKCPSWRSTEKRGLLKNAHDKRKIPVIRTDYSIGG